MKPQPEIKVALIACTSGEPAGLTSSEILIYTKATRLQQGEDTRAKIKAMTSDERSGELAYMADTIPSSWEFLDYTFEITNVTRAFTHQFVRTRTGSYAQQTMRMLEKKGFTYRVPPRLLEPKRHHELALYEACMREIQAVYDTLIEQGVAPEDARGVLPTNIHTNIIAKFNLRTLAEMAKSRTGARTQDEYREVMDAIIDEVIKIHPWARMFLLPEQGRHAKSLEETAHTLLQAGAITKEERVAMLKHIDAMRKGAS
jgi:flavin-dependent thymidylate synthase